MNAAASHALGWRELAISEAGLVLALHRRAIAGLDREIVRADGLEQFERHLSAQGRIVGGFVGSELIAYGVLSFEPQALARTAALLGIEHAGCARLALLDGASVHPAWRGRGLHHALIREREALAAAHGRQLLMVTVAPTNVFSLRALLAEGFRVSGYSVMYEGAPRLLMVSDRRRWPRPAVIECEVALDDLQAHQQALQQRLLGVACTEHKGRPHLAYVRPEPADLTLPAPLLQDPLLGR